jgi:hypothetical protein
MIAASIAHAGSRDVSRSLIFEIRGEGVRGDSRQRSALAMGVDDAHYTGAPLARE